IGPGHRVGFRIPMPASYSGQPLRFSEFKFLLMQRLFDDFAFRNVYGHAHHALGLAVDRVIELSLGCHPAEDAVGPDDSELGNVRLMLPHRTLNCLPDLRPVLRVHMTPKVFHISPIGTGGNAEDRLKITEPTLSTAFDVPIPSN